MFGFYMYAFQYNYFLVWMGIIEIFRGMCKSFKVCRMFFYLFKSCKSSIVCEVIATVFFLIKRILNLTNNQPNISYK